VYEFKEHTEVVVFVCEILVVATIFGKKGCFSARFKPLGLFFFVSLLVCSNTDLTTIIWYFLFHLVDQQDNLDLSS